MRTDPGRGGGAGGGLRSVALQAALARAYLVAVLFGFFLRTHIDRDYRVFLFLRQGQSMETRLEEIEGSFFERLAPFDGQFYRDIAANGYRRFSEAGGMPGNFAFFPLLPWLYRLVSIVAGDALPIALLLNVGFSVAGSAGLWLLARRIGGSATASVACLLAFPTAVFQCLLYTESLFLFLSVFAGLCAVEGRHRTAALLGYLCGLCRPQGVLMGLLLGVEWFRHAGGWRAARPRLLEGIAVCSAPLLGLLTFACINAIELGSAVAFLEIQESCGRSYTVGGLVSSLAGAFSYGGPVTDIAGTAYGIGLLPFLWRRLRPSLALYGTALVVLPLLTGTVLSMGRFLSVSFPHFLCLGAVLDRRPWAFWSAVGVMLVWQAALARAAMAWEFIG